jgi:hypothetical protein
MKCVTTIDARWRGVECELVQGEVPSPSDIVALANATPTPPRYVSGTDYAEAVAVLKDEKQMTWNEVGEWFKGKGLPFSLSTLQQAYYAAKRPPPRVGAMGIHPSLLPESPESEGCLNGNDA